MKQRGLIKKLSAVLLATVMTVSTFPQFSTSVYATDIANGNTENTYDNLSTNTLSTNETLNVEGGIEGKDYTYENGVIRLLKDGNYTIIGDGNVTTDRIIVEDNVNISLTLRNVNIRTQNTSCLEVKGTANVTLWLEGENSLRVNEHDPAALQFESVTTGSLIIDSKTNGKLVAYAWNGAAIGGGMWGAPKNLIIKGGIISAISGRSANAIGKGWYSSEDSDITIEGGIISTSSIMESNNGLGGTENSKITIKGGYIDCGITGNAVVLGGYITGNVSGTVTNDNGIKLNKVNIPLMLDNVKEIWIDGVNQNINNTFTDALLQLYLTPEKHKIKIVDSNGNEKTYVININGKIDGNSFIELPKNLSITYNKNLKLSDIDLSNANWVWVDKNTVLSAGTKSYPASFDTTSLESTTDFSNVEGYDPNTHKVTKNVEVKVDKADSAVTITTQSLNKAYDGNAVSIPEYTTSGSDGKVTIKWQKNTGSADTPKWEDLKSAPSKVGTYRVVIELAGNDNYKPASATLDFTISKADNAWAKEFSIKGWKYNETANVPTAKAQFGDVKFTYSSEENGTYTSKVPKNAGTYYVKATVAGTKNYTGLESAPVSFEIAKADTTLAFEKDNIDKIYDKNVISEPKVNKTGSSNDITFAWFVANGNDWTLLDNAPSDVGAYKVVVSAKEDTNYNGASIEKEFSISMADNEWTKKLSIKDWTYGEKPSVPSATAKYGDVVYTYSDSKDGTYTSEVPKNAGTYYVKASVAGTAKYTGLESAPVSFKIKKADSSIKFKDGVAFDKVYDTNAIVVAEEHLEKTGSTGKVSFIFEKKVNDEWKNVETPTKVGTYRVTANLAGDDNYTSATSKPLEFTISKDDSAVNITTQSLNKAYDGNAVRVPKYTTSGSDGKVTIKWQKNTGSADTPKWEDLKSAPSKVGTYRVVIELAGNDNYKPASATLDFTISKADNAWAKEFSIKGWKYNETANVPTAKAQFGDVKFTYSSEENGTYTSEVPKNAGIYYVKASVAGTENYTGLESAPVAFEIAKAIPSYEKVTGLVLGQGQALSKIELPEQFKWVDETMTADELGTHTFKAIYTPEDTANYQTIEVKVVPTPVAINHVPTINASDKAITVGDKFKPLKDVIANDKEDGDLTSKIKVIKNTVDTKKAGTYEVTYQVTDSQGATVTKTIKVTVKTAPVNPDKDKPNNDKGNVETRDQTNVGLFTTLSIISALGIAILAIWKKKR